MQPSLATRRINEIAPIVIVSVQKLETRLLVHGAHAKILAIYFQRSWRRAEAESSASRHWVKVDVDRGLLVVVEVRRAKTSKTG